MDMFVVVDDDNQEGEVVDHYLPHKLQVEDVVEIVVVVVVVYDMDHADDYCIDGLGRHIAESNLNQSCVYHQDFVAVAGFGTALVVDLFVVIQRHSPRDLVVDPVSSLDLHNPMPLLGSAKTDVFDGKFVVRDIDLQLRTG